MGRTCRCLHFAYLVRKAVVAMRRAIDEGAELLSVREAADRLNTSEPHVRALVRRSELPAVKLGRLIRIPVSAVQRIVARAERAR